MDYQHPAIEQLFLGLEEGIFKAVDYMKSEYSLVRPGRANPKLLERIYVDYYGTNTPVGVTPNNDGSVIRLPFPSLTEERRREYVKNAKKLAEDTKVVVRNARRDIMDGLKKAKNDKIVSEDSIKDFEEEAEKIVSKAIENIDSLAKEKETEIMAV